MFTYGHLKSKTPLCPEALLRIYNPSDPSYHHEVQAIVDSGAVMTCIPKSVIDQLGKNLEYSTVRGIGLDGSSTKIEKKLVRLTIIDDLGNTVHDQEIFILAVPGKNYALIGRDILNQYKVVLNAPEERWRLNCTASCD